MSIHQPDIGTVKFRSYIEFAANGQLYLTIHDTDIHWTIRSYDHDTERAMLASDTGTRSRGMHYRDIHGKATFVAPTSVQATIDEWSDQP